MPLFYTRITQEDDECEAYYDGEQWQFRKNFSEQGVGFWSNQQQKRGGAMLFRNITIPQGSKINFARIVFIAKWDDSTDICSSFLQAELNPNPLPFSTYPDYRDRYRTREDFYWWKMDKWSAYYPEISPNFFKVVQEVVNLKDWFSGANLVVFWHDHWGYSTPNRKTVRRAFSFNSDPARCPLLQITYELPVPPPPPIPPPDKWAAEDLQQVPVPDGYTFLLHTDRPCHLWLRYTLKEPWRHSKPIYRRGVYLRGDIRFCFVEYVDVEQEEPGDTLDHTWTLLNWPICQTRWLYYHGQINGVNTPSVSPIFIKHRPVLFNVRLFYEPWTHLTPPPPTMASIFEEPWSWITLFDTLLHEEPWTYPSMSSPTMELILTEPWTFPGILPPTMAKIFTEPWTYPSPPPPTMALIFTEPWSPVITPPPSMGLLFSEFWTHLTPPPPPMVKFIEEPWSS